MRHKCKQMHEQITILVSTYMLLIDEGHTREKYYVKPSGPAGQAVLCIELMILRIIFRMILLLLELPIMM